MKVSSLATVLLPSLAAASKCKPATYRCEQNEIGWDVCSASGDWVFAGRCPPGTVCKFNQASGSPYCIPHHHIEVNDKCRPATYRCERSGRAWDVCNSQGDWVFAGRCPHGTVCKFNVENGSPYCLPRHIVAGDVEVEDYVDDEGDEL